MTRLPLIIVLALASASSSAQKELDVLAPNIDPYRLSAIGFVTDSSHPKHPGDFFRAEVVLRIDVDRRVGEAVIECESGEGDEKEIDRYFFRRGRIFQMGEDSTEIDPEKLGDLSPATVAAIHPTLVLIAMNARPENLDAPNGGWFAWNDEMWRIDRDGQGWIESVSHRTSHDVYGDGVEELRYHAITEDRSPRVRYPLPKGLTATGPVLKTTVLRGDRIVAEFEFMMPGFSDPPFDIVVPDGNRDRDRSRVVSYDELQLDKLAPHLFKIDIVSMNTRVMVAEFSDYVFVIEGAYNSQACDLVAKRVRETIKKPVRYFAFSHLHGQYIGGTRSWVHEGATILVPPTTKPMVEEMVAASHKLRPDTLSYDPKRLRIETVKERRLFEDDANAVEVFNVESGHTDEYFIFYFPRSKILLTGDLLFYRPGQPLKGRSKQLCETIGKLGLDPDRFVATWPLAGYDTKNIVSGDEMRAACAE